MKKLLICSALASLVSANAMAYNVTETFTVSVTMASAISFSTAPGNISISSLKPATADTATTTFTVDGDDAQTLTCSLSGTDVTSGANNATLYKDSDKAANPSDTLIAGLTTDCNDGTSSTITLTVESGDTDASDIGKSFGVDGNVTLTVAYQ